MSDKTFWRALIGFQAEEYTVEVLHGKFTTQHEAEQLHCNTFGLTHENGRLILHGKGWTEELADDQIRVFRLKDESQGKFMVDDSDFELTDIKIAEFRDYPPLTRGFDFLFYSTTTEELHRPNETGEGANAPVA